MNTTITTEDRKQFKSDDLKCVGSVDKVRSRDLHTPAKIGEFPVFVEQTGAYRIFTYSKKIVEITHANT